MTAEEKEKKIKENKELIAKLSKEIKDLQESKGIAGHVTEGILTWRYDLDERVFKPGYATSVTRSHEDWTSIKTLCMRLFGNKVLIKDLTHEQVLLAAEMADEIIRVRNKYFKQVHHIGK